jgi:ribonuclease BN (tRNA processing enzyme)
VGDASQAELGHASAAFSHGEQRLLIDCGPGVLDAFFKAYQALPDAVFITHCHLDHIADFEKLFIKSWFSNPRKQPLVIVPAPIIPLLHERVGTYPGALAEGGVNFWQGFQLIPVSRNFELFGLRFEVKPARHHGPNSAFSLYLPDVFYYTGDTRPIPEILEHEVSASTAIFHDCSVQGNPSHSGIDDLKREYSDDVLRRVKVYHYNSKKQKEAFVTQGLECVEQGQSFVF